MSARTGDDHRGTTVARHLGERSPRARARFDRLPGGVEAGFTGERHSFLYNGGRCIGEELLVVRRERTQILRPARPRAPGRSSVLRIGEFQTFTIVARRPRNRRPADSDGGASAG